MSHCIIGFKKIKDNLKISSLAEHNLRLHTKLKRLENIDALRSDSNIVLKNTFNVVKSTDLGAKLNEFYQSKGIKVRKDNVLALDVMITTSPEYWGDWKNELGTPELTKKMEVWKDIQMKIMEEKFGADAIKLAVLHLDENTPHIHFFITPEETKEITTKNRYDTTTKTKTILNNNKHNPAFFTKLVDDLAKVNAVLGLERGKEGSEAQNVPLKHYKDVLQRETTKTRNLGKTYARALENETAQKALIVSLSKENQRLQKKLLEAEDKLFKQTIDKKMAAGQALSEDELSSLYL